MPKALIITYYWPPAGGGGVQRWLKFSRYMRDFGWEPVIFTPDNPELSNFDQSLLEEVPGGLEVIKLPIWEPFNAYKKLLGKSREEKIQPGFLQESSTNSLLQKISVWIRGNLFIPDAKKFWIKPSVRFLSKYIRSSDIEVIISTGPPHSNHVIARNVKRATGIKWLADFRDPWTNIDYYEKLMLSARSDKKHRKLEASVIKEADEVVTVSWSWARDFEKNTGVLPRVITNGYDSEDFQELPSMKAHDELIITHIGSLNADRNPHAFWAALESMYKENGNLPLKVKLIGPTDISVFRATESLGISNLIQHVGHMPHKDVITDLCQADVLLLPLNDTPNIDGVIPGKLYEYLASRRPIMAIGKINGDAAKIISESAAGNTFDFKDSNGIEAYLKKALEDFKKGGVPSNSLPPNAYSRLQLTSELCRVLDGMIAP